MMLQNDLKVSITNIASTAAKNIVKAMNVEQPELHRFTVIHRDNLSIILINYPIQHLEYNYVSFLFRSFEVYEIDELIIVTSNIHFIQESIIWDKLNEILDEESLLNIQKEYEEELAALVQESLIK